MSARVGHTLHDGAVRRGDHGQRLQTGVDAGADIRRRTADMIPLHTERDVPGAGLDADAGGLHAAAPAEALLETKPTELRDPDPPALDNNVLV